LAVQFTSIKEAGFNRKATRGASRVVAFFFETSFFIGTAILRQVDDSLLVENISPDGLVFWP
jgi:hypothetical protein